MWDLRTWEGLGESKHSCAALLSRGAYSMTNTCLHMGPQTYILWVCACFEEKERRKLTCVCMLSPTVCVFERETSEWVQLLGIYCERLKSRLRLVLSDRPSGSVSGTTNPVNSPLPLWTLESYCIPCWWWMGLTVGDKAMFTKAVRLPQSRFCTNAAETMCTTWCAAKRLHMLSASVYTVFGSNAALLGVLLGHDSCKIHL